MISIKNSTKKALKTKRFSGLYNKGEFNLA